MKHLISLISTKGKTTEQVGQEVMAAHEKYHKMFGEELRKLDPDNPILKQPIYQRLAPAPPKPKPRSDKKTPK